MRFIDSHRKQLKKQYKTFEEFNRSFEVPQSLIDSIVSKAAEDGVKPADDDELTRTLPYLTAQLKALIARDLWDMNEYYRVMNETNPIVLKALEVMNAL